MKSNVNIFILIILSFLYGCNGAEDLILDTTAPVNATSLSWEETNPAVASSTTVTAYWSPSVSADLDLQIITFYSDSTCTTTRGISEILLFNKDTFEISVTPSESYFYTIKSYDIDGNSSLSSCSDEMTIQGTDIIFPEEATNIAWAETSPSMSLTVTATWDLSIASDLTTQRLEYFTDSACTTSTGTVRNLGNTETSDILTGAHLGNYYFMVTSIDDAGNETDSDCSTLMHINTADVTPPNPALVLGWAQSSPHNTVLVNAVWNKSTSTDVASQTLTFYTDATCSTPEGTVLSFPASTASYLLTGTNLSFYYYNINTIDTSGNATLSGCSTEMELNAGGDTTPPLAATSPVWVETTPYNSTTITPTWSPSASGDLNSQRVNYFTDAACTISYVDGGLLGAVSSSDSFTGGINNLTFYFTVTSMDSAGNTSVSSCSNGVTIDTTPPVSATSLSWIQTSPHNSLSVTASWSPSVSADVANQTITYYTDSSCTAFEGTTSVLSSASATDSFSGVDLSSYYYKIITTDTAGNNTPSSCSPVMDIAL